MRGGLPRVCKSRGDVIRIGLQSGEGLTSGRDIACGDYSESIGEQCISRYFLNEIREKRGNCEGVKMLTVYISPRRLSSAVGYQAQNRKLLQEEFKGTQIRFKICDGLSEFEIKTETE